MGITTKITKGEKYKNMKMRVRNYMGENISILGFSYICSPNNPLFHSGPFVAKQSLFQNEPNNNTPYLLK